MTSECVFASRSNFILT